MNLIVTKLAGVTFGDAQENIRKFGRADIGTYALIRESDNPHDPNAIKVALFGMYFMGYIPKDVAKEVASMMEAGKRFTAEFVCLNACSFSDTMGLTIKVSEIG